MKIKGITIQLCVPREKGRNGMNEPEYEDRWIDVDNVLVAPASSNEIVDAQQIYGRKAVYTLAIPKGDTHDWENKKVKFFGQTWETFGIPLEGIESLIPLDWNKKVTVSRCE